MADCHFLEFILRSSHPEVFLEKDVLKIYSKLRDSTHAEVWSHFGMGISCKFDAYFQNTFN